jgi:hypothetical protein
MVPAVRYSSDPFAGSPTWTSVTGLPAGSPPETSHQMAQTYISLIAGTSNSFGLWKVNAISHRIQRCLRSRILLC